MGHRSRPRAGQAARPHVRAASPPGQKLSGSCHPGRLRSHPVTAILVIQVGTFLALGVCFIASGQVRLGIAQLLLALVQVVIYSGGVNA